MDVSVIQECSAAILAIKNGAKKFNPDRLSCLATGRYGAYFDTPSLPKARKEAYENLMKSAVMPAVEMFNKAVASTEAWIIAELEAEIRGEIAPEPAPDSYLDPVRSALGQHCGLNADWNSHAWRLSGNDEIGVYLVDQEINGIMSILSRHQDEGDAKIVEIANGDVSTILPLALSLRH